MKLINADALMKSIYHTAFETDGDSMWKSGCWVRYRAIERVVNEQPAVQPEVTEEQVKEAIETLEANYPDACYEQLREAVDVALVILKQMAKMEDDLL